jgi:hypothetical protein
MLVHTKALPHCTLEFAPGSAQEQIRRYNHSILAEMELWRSNPICCDLLGCTGDRSGSSINTKCDETRTFSLPGVSRRSYVYRIISQILFRVQLIDIAHVNAHATSSGAKETSPVMKPGLSVYLVYQDDV